MALGDWATNADLIADLPRLGYLHEDWITLDPTWGLGNFWTTWRPHHLVGHDIDKTKAPDGQSLDGRQLPYSDDTFDAVVIDGPYKLNGTSRGASDNAYGVHTPASREGRHELIRDLITEGVRVLRPRGYLLVKCQDQVNGGKVRWQTRIFADHAETLGCRLVDMLHLSSYRPQPPGRAQQHARRNYSTLLVLRLEQPHQVELFDRLRQGHAA